MNRTRHAQLIRYGHSQVLHIPREFELPGKEVILRKEGGWLILEPVKTRSLLAVLDTLKPVSDEFPDV